MEVKRIPLVLSKKVKVLISVTEMRREYQRIYFKIVEKLGLAKEVYHRGFDRIDPELSAVLHSTTSKEPGSRNLPRWTLGSIQQRERLVLAAELCARRYSDDFIEIGAYKGETTLKLAEVARKYSNRRVIVVDPWKPGIGPTKGGEYKTFLKNIEPYADIVDVIRGSSLDKNIISLIKQRSLSFAFIDGLHTYAACLSDILTVSHTLGFIAVDDIRYMRELMFAFRRGAYITGRIPLHLEICREGYLIKANLPEPSQRGIAR
jgi:predicted O-methyltransferase YrrM